jgi:hypothetical protein
MQFLWLMPSMLMGVYLGATTGMWQLAVMSAVSGLTAVLVSRLRSREPRAEPEIRFNRRGVWVGKRRLPRSRIFWRKSWKVAVDKKLKADFAGGLQSTRADSLSFVAGYGFELNLLEHGPHLFLVGPTGSGKSRWLDLVLRSVRGSPKLLLADYKGGATLSGFGECITDLSAEQARNEFWVGLGDLLEERERYLRLHRASRAAEVHLQPVLVVVDELVHALRLDRVALPALSAVAARGRSLSVHLICASQSVSGVPRELLVNLGLRVILCGTDEVDALQLGAKQKPTARAGFGSGLAVGFGEFSFPFSPEPIRGLPR